MKILSDKYTKRLLPYFLHSIERTAASYSIRIPRGRFAAQAARFFLVILCGAAAISAGAQTLSLNDGSILQSKTNRVGMNIGAIDYWDSGQILKNLIGSSDPGMEPLQNRQIWVLTAAGSGTTFTVPDIYDVVPANYWAGGTATVVEAQSGGAELGCEVTVASNTGPNYPVTGGSDWVAPVVTVASACKAPFAVGDMIVLSKRTFPTPESWWETGGNGGTSGGVKGGARMVSDTTDLCATCGTQALNMDASTPNSSATATWGFDSESSDDVFVLMNGTYSLTFWAKAVSGAPVLSASANRGSVGGFNCGSYKPALTTSWAQYTWTCTASESAAALTPAAVLIAFNVTAGSIYLDNVSFAKVDGNPENTTVLRDEVVDTLQKFYGPTPGGNPGTLRYWVNQNGETIDNWTQPDESHMPTGSGTGYFISPGGKGTETLSLEDYLEICKYLNASPYLEIPVTLTAADAANLIQFLAGDTGTAYGARRKALGQSLPWTSVFSTIHLALCDECWNTVFAGQNLPVRKSGPDQELYYDYSVRARDIFSAMRAETGYTQAGFDLVMNAQTGGSSTMDQAIQRAHPDSIEIESYTMGPVSAFATDSELWTPAMIDPWEKVMNPKDIRNFYQSVHDYQSQTACGAKGTATCAVNIYEWGQGTVSGGIDQTHLDYINAGAGEGVVMALQPLLNMQYYGIGPQSFFALNEYKNGASNGMTSKLWGAVVDMGGATNNVRPEFLGMQVANESIIGPMYSCTVDNNLTYNFAGSPNGVSPMPAMTGVPYLYAFCFENGTKRSLVLINTDLANSHPLTFGGINPPAGSVVQRQYAPSSLDDMNEAATGTETSHATATSAIETSSLSSPKSITLPPFSVTALDYTASGAEATAMIDFTPPAGTYSTAQSVVLSSATAGTTLYYTTNGTAPTTASTVYSGPIVVGTSETLEAIAVKAGSTTGPTAEAVYQIDPLLPTPTVNPAPGTYATAQSVTLGESTAGATLYYSTDGSTPTAASTKYTGAIRVSSSETVRAVAVETGYTTSAVAVAVFTIAAALPAPTISPASGNYSGPFAVRMADTNTGAIVYYTTNGATPTTASTQYRGAIWLSSSATFRAIAYKSGNTNSPVTTAIYTFGSGTPSPTFSPAAGSYTVAQLVSIADATSGAAIYYTTNGSTPTASSARYTGAIRVSVSETLSAIAVANGSTSAEASAAYIIGPRTATASPTFSPAAGVYSATQSVTLLDKSAGAVIYYTTNGFAPTTSSTRYTQPFAVADTETVMAIAVEPGSNNSSIAEATYTFAQALPAPVFSVAGGSYTHAQSVALSDAESGSTIYYTTDGSAPTTASTLYREAVTVSTSETITAMAVKSGFSNSRDAAAAYTIGSSTSVAAAPTISPAPGTYTSSFAVQISTPNANAIVYYTTDGSAPTAASTQYRGAIWLNASTNIEAIAVEQGSSNSRVVQADYVIAPYLPNPTFSPASGNYAAAQRVTIADQTAGTTIHYTTDGSAPTTSSAVYSGPLSVASSGSIRAIAVKSGFTDSQAVTETYSIQ